MPYNFGKQLDVGHKYESYIQGLLEDEGFDVTQPNHVFVNPNDYSKHQTDLVVYGLDGVPFLPVMLEVKSSRQSFTSNYDYPYKLVTVNRVTAWEDKQRKPDLTVLVSQPTGKAFSIPTQTRPHWRADLLPNKFRTAEVYDYRVDKRYTLNWTKTVDYLKRLAVLNPLPLLRTA